MVIDDYQHRMLVGHLTMGKLCEAQSALFALWAEEKAWDNQKMIDKTTADAYDALQEAIQQIQRGLSVEHYG